MSDKNPLSTLHQLFGKPSAKDNTSAKDAAAKILQMDPKALEAFEAAYAKHALEREPEHFFATNSRQAAEAKHHIEGNTPEMPANSASLEDIMALQKRIVAELLSQTEIYTYDGKRGYAEKLPALPVGTDPVQNEDISRLPAAVQPQLSGNLMAVDIAAPTYLHLLELYQKSKSEQTKKKRDMAYNMFRQGLDILDLDAVTYEIIGTNPNSMGHWLPQLVDACAGQEFFKIPATTIAKVPLSMLQLTRLDYQMLTQTTLGIVDAWAKEAFQLDESKEYFIKTGTYSSKFDFRNAWVHGAKEVKELGEYLLYIHFQALQMAGPLTQPCIYGVSTTNEWVVREFIHDKEGNPCIYKGLPLHTEYRIFVDCDTDQIIGVTPYWEPETMKKRFGHEADANSPHQIHDYVIYKAHEETLMKRYHENKDRVLEHIAAILPNLELNGQWSIDIMQNGEDFWIIDMAVAENSAFYDCVPESYRKPREENWIPCLKSSTKKE